ncbi:hypothetical protein MMC09_002057 [Bachmanniomyces sp. S44760]|nr:hypothetical protein [Bachmanniomyces sp. S44760]
MSSRALRKLQREQEDQRISANLAQEDIDKHSQGSSEEPDEIKSSRQVLNAFNMLNTFDNQDHEEQDDVIEQRSDDEEEEEERGTARTACPEIEATRKPKKKKGKKKRKAVRMEDDTNVSSMPSSQSKQSELDEIDQALRSLGTKHTDQDNGTSTQQIDDSLREMYRLLATDTRNLNALNEMKRLFGNVILEGENEGAAVADPRGRRGRGPRQLDLGGALAGRNSPVSRGQGLAGLALRRNIFMLGKEEWPKATSGGLGMEVVEKPWDGTTEYRFVHNSAYRDVQRQFQSCVESMEPQRMIQLLQFNPYHISTLLQISEIAKQQGDHSVSGDLLERALFSFGRSVNSSFPAALSEGKARLDFRRPENREFWLACWRYISNLAQRGTWRTAYEWAKLLLSLDPEGDPYCIGLILDQLAIRGGQSAHYTALSNCNLYHDQWARFPNVSISTGLAHNKLKHPKESRSCLTKAIQDYPWVFARLFQELGLDNIPKSIWGKSPRSDRERFESEMYVIRAKDLWNTPESISLLVEVVEATNGGKDTPINKDAITLDEARHVLLSDVPSLISLVPRTYTTMETSSSDPLKPLEDLPSYEITPVSDPHQYTHTSREGPLAAVAAAVAPSGTNDPTISTANEAQELRGLHSFFSRIMPWLGLGSSTTNDRNPNANLDENSLQQTIDQAMEDSDVPPELIESQRARMQELQRLMLEAQQRQMRTPDEQEAARAEDVLDHDPSATDANDEDEFFNADLDRVLENMSARLETLNDRTRPHNNNDEPDRSHRTQQEAAPGPHVPTTSSSSPPHSPPSLPPTSQPEPYDDNRNQRWLAGQGLLALKTFCIAHGTDESSWNDTAIDTGIVYEYAARLKKLEKAASRKFILDYALRQGAGAEVRELVVRVLG